MNMIRWKQSDHKYEQILVGTLGGKEPCAQCGHNAGTWTRDFGGKALVCAALLCKVNRRWLPSLCNAKLLALVERLMKEKDPYVQQCMEALVQTIVGGIPGILESIATDIVNLTSAKRANTIGLGAAPLIGRGSVRSSIPLFPVVMNNPTFQTQGQDEFQLTSLKIVEVLPQQPGIMLAYPDIFIEQVLPSLAFLYKQNTDGDMRFLCLKVFFDLLVVCLDDISSVNTLDSSKLPETTGMGALAGRSWKLL